MPTILPCTGCGKKLRIPHDFQRPQARCPACGAQVTLRPPAEPDDELARPRGGRRAEHTLPEREPRRPPHPAEDENIRRPRQPAAEEDEDRPRRRQSADEADEEEAPSERPRAKRRRRRRPAADAVGMPEWARWSIALAGYLLLLVLVGFALSAAGHGVLVTLYAVGLAVLVPASLVILILSMFLSSWVSGGIDFGEIHVVIPKALLLLLLVNTVAALPVEGTVAGVLLSAVTLLIWLAGLMYFFKLDFWEARILIAVNWVLNYLVKWLIFVAIVSAILRGGPPAPGGDGRLFPEQPATQEEKDLDRIEQLGGDFDLDENLPDEPVVKITFAGSRVRDADLALLPRFPKLRTLDLSRTQITDAGLEHLKGLRELELVVLTGTRVTDSGVQGLRQALPRAKLVLR